MQTQPAISAEVRSHRYPELDALRGLAAATVVFHHLLLLWGTSAWYRPLLSTPLRLFVAGPQAVVLFFVLSGFVLSSAENASRRSNYVGYLLKRLCRIYLPYLGALGIAGLCATHFFLKTPTDNSWINQTWSHAPRPWEFLLALGTSMKDAAQYNTAFWSIFLELRISLIFPALFLLVKRLPMWISLALIGLAIAFSPFLPSTEWPQIVAAGALFALGIVAFLHRDRLRDWLAARNKAATWAVLLLSFVVYTYGSASVPLAPQSTAVTVAQTQRATASATSTSTSVFHTELKQARYLLCALASLAFMFAAITVPAIQAFLNKPFLFRLGGLSYSTYLVHGTVLFALARGVLGTIPVAAFVLLYIALVYAASELFWMVIDVPSLRLGRAVGKMPLLQRKSPRQQEPTKTAEEPMASLHRLPAFGQATEL